MKIMYINDTGFDSPNSNNHLILSMLLQFLDEGNEIYYVGSHSTGTFDDIPSELLNKSDFTYDIILKPIVNRSNFVKRYLTAIQYERNARRKWKDKIKEIDIVIVQSHYTAFFTFKYLKKYKKKTIFNIFDIFPGTTFTASGMPSRFVYFAFYKMQKSIYKQTSAIFTLTKDTRKSLIDMGVLEQKIHIIPNWFDSERVARVSCDSFFDEFQLDRNKKYIQYAGQIGISYDFFFLVKVAEKLKYRQDIIFEFVGDGLNLKELKAEVEHRRLSNVVFIPWQPLERLSEVYSSCTLQMVPLKKEIIYNSYPSKILPLMGCKRTAVISVEKESFFYDEMNDNKIAKCVPLNDVDAFCDAVIKLCDDETLREEYEKNAYEFVIKKYTARKNINKMISVFSKLMEE